MKAITNLQYSSLFILSVQLGKNSGVFLNKFTHNVFNILRAIYPLLFHGLLQVV